MDIRLDRRRFLLTSASVGALTQLAPVVGCNPVAGPLEPEGEPGEFGNPYTRDNPGPYADVAALHLPAVYAGLINETEVRLWVEVRDIENNLDHPQQLDHFVDQIILRDDFQNDIAARGFNYETQARVIATVTLQPPVRSIYVWHRCNQTGYWRDQYSIADLNVAPVGDTRRAFTAGQPKGGADALQEVPILGQLPTGDFAVEVGNRAQNKLHPMTPDHYIQSILIYDENDQLRQVFNLGPNYAEPVVTFAPLGTARVRVIAYCNLHNYWEGEYVVGPPV